MRMTGAGDPSSSEQDPGWVGRFRAAVLLAFAAAPLVMSLYLVLTIVSGLGPVVSAWLIRSLLDAVVRHESLRHLVVLGAALSVAGVVTGTLPQLGQYLRAQAERRTGLLAQDRLFTAVNSFVGIGRFEDPHFLDRLRLAQQVARTGPGQVLEGTLGILRTSITIGGLCGSLFLFSPVVAVLVLCSGVPMLLAEAALSRRRVRMLGTIGPTERRELFYSSLLSTAEAAKEVRMFGIGDLLRRRMLAERRTANRARQAMDRREVIAQGSLEILAAAVAGAGLLLAVAQAHSGSISVGDVAMFVAAVSAVQGSLAALAGDVAGSNTAVMMFGHYVAVTRVEADLPVAPTPKELPRLHRGIELRDVWFRYAKGHPWVLRGVNLFIPAGTETALVGLNGAGKTTLVKLLCRLYDPTQGSIFWDGIDLRDLDPTQLRCHIGALFQDFMSYDLTAADNIGLGDPEVFDDRSRIEAAARLAGIDEDLARLPRGYDTMLSRKFFGESGHNNPDAGISLSGGQQQRLALARVFLRDRRDLMVLDEPSAGLDAVAEHEMHASLRKLRQGGTSLLISHRLAAIREADQIVVLRDGQVLELGDHRTLMAAESHYAQLFRLQAAGYLAESCSPPAHTIDQS